MEFWSLRTKYKPNTWLQFLEDICLDNSVNRHTAYLSQRWVYIKEEGAVNIVTSHFSKVSLIPTKEKASKFNKP